MLLPGQLQLDHLELLQEAIAGTIATVAATGDSTIAYSETTNVLTNSSQANCSLNSSTGAITTTDLGGSSTTGTTYNFTLRVN